MKTNTRVTEVGICSGMTKNKSCVAAKLLLGAALVGGDQTTLPMVKRPIGRFEFQTEWSKTPDILRSAHISFNYSF